MNASVSQVSSSELKVIYMKTIHLVGVKSYLFLNRLYVL